MATRELYGSANGDRWFLIRDPAGHVLIRHEANLPSGSADHRGAVPSQPIYPLLTRLCPEPIEVPFSKWEGFLSVGAEQSPVLRRECRSYHREFVEPPGLSLPITGGRPLGGMSR